MFVFNKPRRDANRQRLQASARRAELDRLLSTDGKMNYSPPDDPNSRESQPNEYRIKKETARAFFAVLLSTASIIIGILYGGPVLGNDWNAVPLLLASSVFVVAIAESVRLLRRVSSIDQIWIPTTGILLIGVFGLGVQGQVVIEGKPYWRNSATAYAYKLAAEIRDDLYILQENQSLLSYPPEQARGLLALYGAAAGQAEELSIRWNPATAPSDLPVPGFLVVYERMNSAADQQRQALLGYAAYLQQPDARLAEEIDRSRVTAEQTYLLAATELANAVRPLGIELSKQED